MGLATAQLWNYPNSKLLSEDDNGLPSRAWQNWFGQLGTIGFAQTLSGPTAERPTARVLASDPPSPPLWIGRVYYDTTLHQPIWYDPDPLSAPPNIWRDATGTFV